MHAQWIFLINTKIKHLFNFLMNWVTAKPFRSYIPTLQIYLCFGINFNWSQLMVLLIFCTFFMSSSFRKSNKTSSNQHMMIFALSMQDKIFNFIATIKYDNISDFETVVCYICNIGVNMGKERGMKTSDRNNRATTLSSF